MSDIGWNIHHTSMLFTDNHWYKENSVALMLVPQNVDLETQTNQRDWVDEYKSHHCDQGLTITLKHNGQYQVLSSQNVLIEQDYAVGQWVINPFPYLELRPKDPEWGFYFTLKTYVETDKISKVQISELTPMSDYSIFAGCTFVSGIRI